MRMILLGMFLHDTADFLYADRAVSPSSRIAYIIRRCTGFKTIAQPSGNARWTITDIA